MRAARDFVATLDDGVNHIHRIMTELYGSLALTGKGHGTDRAIILGLLGEKPDEVDPGSIEAKIEDVRARNQINIMGKRTVAFLEDTDLLFRTKETLPGHSNAMRFTAFDASGNVIGTQVYFSIGGGFIQREGATASTQNRPAVPYPFRSGDALLQIGEDTGLPIWKIALENEKAWRSESEIRDYITRVWHTMQACLNRGLQTDGILPGGLKVRRRAPAMSRKLAARNGKDPLTTLDWVNAFAMAVNEENAAGGRVVTAPTNGAAGIIPAVGEYYARFIEGATSEGILQYLLTASAIGILYKENASISGAEVGCQGEVGVACSMAAGGLVAAQGGSNLQIEYAAEIGMEHNLGMTCDPIGGLVQIPCIERNAMGSVKAINAARIAMQEGGEHKVSLDQVIKTMYQTGLDMQSRYKETSLAGLALNVIEC
jgi:L-serine dehydratase